MGAESIITKNISDNSVVAGVLAKRIKGIEDYLQDKNRVSTFGTSKGERKG